MSETYDITIIGGGPAGLTAGIYASRARLKTIILEKGILGGQAILTETIENYPGFSDMIAGTDLIARMEEQAKKFGTEIKTLVEVEEIATGKTFKVITSDGKIEARSILVATGSKPKRLGIPGEKEFSGRGVSYCATCDGAFFKDKNLIVVGGGDSAVEEGLFLTRFAKKVYIVHRRDELRAIKILQEKAFKNPKIEFIWNSHLIEIKGDNKVEKAVIKNKIDNKKTTMDIDGVFFYVGVIPNSGFLNDLVDIDEFGYIKTDNNLMAKTAGIFVAGDVRDNLFKQIAVAVGEGASAAYSIQRFLEEQE